MYTTLLINTKTFGTQDPRDRNGEPSQRNTRGPLLLSAVQGIEGMSQPYAYDVTMYHSFLGTDVDPNDLINTPVTIGIRGQSSTLFFEDLKFFNFRRGVFLSFEKDETNEQVVEKQGLLKLNTNFRVYKGRIVPAFQMLDFEIRYRVFEDLTVLEIMQEVMKDFSNIVSYNSYVVENFKAGDKEKLPKMPYCVQFGESSFNFLSRLMGLFDIWYYFDHQPDKQTMDGGRLIEKMVIGANEGGSEFTNSRLKDMSIEFTPPQLREISGLQRGFTPAHKKIFVANFNILVPKTVPRDSATPDSPYDVWPAGTGEDRLQREVFPAPFDHPDPFTPPKDPKDGSPMKVLATSKVQDEETAMFTVQGQCKNPTLVSGRVFHITQDDTKANFDSIGAPGNRNYIVTTLSFSAYENSYGQNVANDIIDVLLTPFRWLAGLFREDAVRQGMVLDPTATLASGGLAQWASDHTPTWLHVRGADGNIVAPPSVKQSVISSMVATSMGASLQAILSSAQGILVRHGDDYSNSFIAVPWDPSATKDPVYNQLPNPDALKPIVHGPHLALVIGRDGVDTKNADIYGDALGRVRVRFPWQRDVPKKGEPIVSGAASGDTDPLKTDRRTAWVRFSEGWAGRHYGTQFMPRIGQEVIVSFIDGDPDRPIITGRAYNADTGPANLPFPNKAWEEEQLKKIPDLPNTAGFDFYFSGIKTASVPTSEANGDAKAKAYHLLRFYDVRDKEQYLIRSQRRLDITALAKRYESIGSDRHLTVGGKKTTPPPKEIGGDYIAKVFRHYYLHVGDPEFPTTSGNRSTKIEQNDYIHVIMNQGQQVDGNWSVTTGGQATIDATGGPPSGGNIVLNAMLNITLKCGASTIVMTPSTIAITSPMVLINSGGPPPVPPIDAAAIPLVEPIAADPGDTLEEAD